MNRSFLRVSWLLFALFLLASSSTFAQSAISGVVRDTSGAVLPGVTVEASSRVLIEKVRTAVTDDVRAATPSSTFDPAPTPWSSRWAGSAPSGREGVELPANFTSTINADMKVGALEESVTVTGASPIVDVQNTQRTQVLNRELLDSLPTARNYSGLAALMPGVRMSTPTSAATSRWNRST